MPPRAHWVSSVQGSVGSPWQAVFTSHDQRVSTTRMSRHSYPRGHACPELQSAPQYVECVRVSVMQKFAPCPQVVTPPPLVQRAQYGR